MRPQLNWLDTEFGPIAAAYFPPVAPARRAVVMVPSVGHETPLMNHSLVALGRRLADAGILGIAVQPFGTDQSAGSLVMPDMLRRWRASVRRGLQAAVDSGVVDIVVVATRVGALMLTADDADGLDVRSATAPLDGFPIAGVVLWSPSVVGRRFVRELRVLRAAGELVTPEMSPAESLNLGGFEYPSALLTELSKCRLLLEHLRSAPAVLVIDHSRRACDPALLADLADATALTHVQHEDAAALANVIDEVSVPADSIDSIIGWVESVPDVRAPAPETRGLPRPPGDLLAHPDGVREEFVTVGSTMSGVFSEGDGSSSSALLLLSSMGPGRRFVELGREEAKRGRAVLRFDFTGSSWSGSHSDKQPWFSYDRRGVHDVAAAANWLRSRGYQTIVAVGFCAGGRALISAAPLAMLAAIVAINVELFEPLRRRATEPSKLERFRVGRLVLRLVRWARGRRGAISSLHHARDARTRLLLMFDDDDHGVRFLRSFRGGRRVVAGEIPGISVHVTEGVGHNLEGRGAGLVMDEIRALLEVTDRGRPATG